MKIEHMGHKPDHGQSVRRGSAMVGHQGHRGDQVACSEARLGPTLVNVILGLLLPKFHDFHDWILLCCHGVLPPHLFPIYLYAQHDNIIESNRKNHEI